MPRIGNARTIADIEYLIEPPGPGSDVRAWTAYGAHCTIDRHRYSGQAYTFHIEVLTVRLTGKRRWHIVIMSELWRFHDARSEPRGGKSLKVIDGKSAEVLSWMRKHRDEKLHTARSLPSE